MPNNNNYEKEINNEAIAIWKRIFEEAKKQGYPNPNAIAVKLNVSSSGFYSALKIVETGSDVKTLMSTILKLASTLNKPIDYFFHEQKEDETNYSYSDPHVLDKILSNSFAQVEPGDYASKVLSVIPFLSKEQQNALKKHMLSYFKQA